MTKLQLVIVVVVLILIQYLLYKLFIHVASSNLHLLAADNTPACYTDLSPPDCGAITGITSDMIQSPTLKQGAIMVASFIAYLGTGNASLINCEPYKLIQWSGDKLPIAIVYGNTVVFRGSMTSADFSTDFQYTEQTKSGSVMIHSGFYNMFQSIKSQIKLDITHPIAILGHSLGCALASLLAYDTILSSNYQPPKITVLNYAPPKVGNQAYADVINKYVNITNVINTADIIPTLPLTYMLNAGKVYQYVHTKNCVTFNDSATDLISCHSMTVYVRNL